MSHLQTLTVWRRRLLPLVALCAALPAAADPVKTVTIAATATVVAGVPHYTRANQRVLDEGWLAAQLRERGIALAWVPVAGDTGATINEAFASHRIDFGAYGDLPSLILNASGTRTQVVVPDGPGLDTFLLVPPDSTAASLKDLKGKRIAVHRGRPWYLTFLRLLHENGFAPGDFVLVNIDLQPSVAALASGNIDALFAINSYTVADKGLGKIIWSSKGRSDKKIRAELWGAREFIDAHPDLTQLVATAYVRAQYWESLDANRQAFIHEATLAGTPERSVLEAYKEDGVAWKDFFTPIFDAALLAHYRRVAEFAFADHLIRTPLKAEELLQPKFVTRALADLRIENFWSQTPVPLSNAALAQTVPAATPR